MTERKTYLLVDGENIDATLGNSVLGRRPHSDERPRWNVLLDYLQEAWDQPVAPLFFLAANGDLPMTFVQALIAMGYRPIPLNGEGKIVDIAIQRTAEALADREGDVVLVSHDRDFAEQMAVLAGQEDRRVGAVGFGEFMAGDLRKIENLEIIDLEYDVQAFKKPLPRVHIIDIDEFDPLDFI